MFGKKGSSAKPVLHDMSPKDVKALLDESKAILIDVREPGEFEGERIHGALLFPLSGFDAKYLPLDLDRPLILQCGSGKRSQMAANLLFEAGVTESWHMEGGIGAWKKAGLPTISFDPETGQWRETVAG